MPCFSSYTGSSFINRAASPAEFFLFVCFVCLFCCFTSQVYSYGHCVTVSSPDHTFSWAGLNKQLTSTSCNTFACNWQQPFLNDSAEGRRMTVEIIWSKQPSFTSQQKGGRECSGSVVECLTEDRGAADSSHTGFTALCPWARHNNPSFVLVQPRKTGPFILESVISRLATHEFQFSS